MSLLAPGDEFPVISLALPDGGTVQLPDALAGHYGVVLGYRGSWCSYCCAQLRAFQRAADSLAEVDARVVALSVDDEATTHALVEKLRLQFPVGHSAGRPRHRRSHRRVRQPGPGVPAVHRFRAEPGRDRPDQRLLQQCHRSTRPRGRRRSRPLRARTRRLTAFRPVPARGGPPAGARRAEVTSAQEAPRFRRRSINGLAGLPHRPDASL
jgi:AhpC/TSA family